MPMTVEASRWWSTRRFSIVSMMLSFAYAIIMGWAYFSVQMAKTPPTPHIVNQIDTAWLTGGLLSVGFAVAAPRRATQSMGIDAATVHSFQSTPARGGRPLTLEQWRRLDYVSIHARARRATR